MCDEQRSTLDAVHMLASLLRRQGKLPEAEPLYREALAGRRARLGEAHADTLLSAVGLALTLQGRSEFGEASALLEQSIERGKDLPKGSETFVRETQQRLRDVYRAWHEQDPSGGHDDQADRLDQLFETKHGD